MPATSERQRKMMCADLGRKRRGEKTRTGMSEAQLSDYCTKGRGHRKKRNKPKGKQR